MDNITESSVKCPRCDTSSYTPYGADWSPGDPMFAAGSRVTEDRSIMICSTCGTDEALRDYQGLPLQMPDTWPVDDTAFVMDLGGPEVT